MLYWFLNDLIGCKFYHSFIIIKTSFKFKYKDHSTFFIHSKVHYIYGSNFITKTNSRSIQRLLQNMKVTQSYSPILVSNLLLLKFSIFNLHSHFLLLYHG